MSDRVVRDNPAELQNEALREGSWWVIRYRTEPGVVVLAHTERASWPVSVWSDRHPLGAAGS